VAKELEPFIMGGAVEVVGPVRQSFYVRYRLPLAVGLNSVAVLLVLFNMVPGALLWGRGPQTNPPATAELRFELSERFDGVALPNGFAAASGKAAMADGMMSLNEGLVIFGREAAIADQVSIAMDVHPAVDGRTAEEIRLGLFTQPSDPGFSGVLLQIRTAAHEGILRVDGRQVVRFRIPAWRNPARLELQKRAGSVEVRLAGESVLSVSAAVLGARPLRGLFTLETFRGEARIDNLSLTVRTGG
jgi:hypothetical protein